MKSIQTLLLLLFIIQLNAQIDDLELNTIQTHAQVDTQVVPDEIYISIITDEEEVKEDLDDIEYKIFFVLANLGINTDEQVIKDDFGSSNKPTSFRKVIKQRRKYQLKVTTPKQAIASIVALNKLDVGIVDILKTTYSKEEELMLNLRTKAMKKAKMQAVALASVLNQKVGKAIMITDIDNNSFADLKSIMREGYLEQDLSTSKKDKKSKEIELKKIHYVKKINVYFELN